MYSTMWSVSIFALSCAFVPFSSAVLNRARDVGFITPTGDAVELPDYSHVKAPESWLEEKEKESETALQCPNNALTLFTKQQFVSATTHGWPKSKDRKQSKHYTQYLKPMDDLLDAFHAAQTVDGKFTEAAKISKLSETFTKKQGGYVNDLNIRRNRSAKWATFNTALRCSEKCMLNVVDGSIPIPMNDPMAQKIVDYNAAITAIHRVAGNYMTKPTFKTLAGANTEIFHFSGHAYMGEDTPSLSVPLVRYTWLLQPEDMFDGQLAPGGFAMLMGCNTADDTGLGFATKFICDGGYNYVGGHVWQLHPTDGQVFIEYFYQYYFVQEDKFDENGIRTAQRGDRRTFKYAWDQAVHAKSLRLHSGTEETKMKWTPAAFYRASLPQSEHITGENQEEFHAIVCPGDNQQQQVQQQQTGNDDTTDDVTDHTEDIDDTPELQTTDQNTVTTQE
uniref:CHAT domain-containing protein n=1 Tax=Chromera velia CCMP2878 TaxID=1169474 RepID=A0A0G4I5B2_9ALVE|eukprot:Cvel_1846.t1-p1 / transcript=Cvel_1846.t1 / gene=Cvel_1846 / organism=Chromera_velia_CCMP2878 / gene_product=hypothetical protein / transcript_product=hypothetical protein / location=Cvel_scaffold68:104215-106802(-) / protein_length=447 / sequence_SO=supercontig / SO=protein_coding / is_pseudo=false